MNWFQLLYDYVIQLNVYYFGNIFLAGNFLHSKLIFLHSYQILSMRKF